MKNIVDYILESKNTLKELLDNLAAYQWKSESFLQWIPDFQMNCE